MKVANQSIVDFAWCVSIQERRNRVNNNPQRQRVNLSGEYLFIQNKQASHHGIKGGEFMMRSDLVTDGIIYFIVKLGVLAVVLLLWWFIRVRPAI